MPYFADKLLDLLPPIYRERDTSGDLRSFLAIPAATLDEIRSLIDDLPDIWNVDACDPRFLPLLAAIVGYAFDPTSDPDVQRREIRETVERCRRKATIPAIHRSLADAGWTGRIDETFHTALRLNKRAITNHAKLPGRIHSLGVYRVESDNLVPGLRRALVEHHPAGTKAFFVQWLYSLESMEAGLAATLGKLIEMVMMGHLHETFVVSHNTLNSGYKLTYKEKTWGLWRVSCHSTLMQDIERAGVRVTRWLGRRPCFKLNAGVLNGGSLANLWISESKVAFTCEVDTGSYHGPVRTALRTSRQHLNRSRLNHAQPACHVLFRQRDFCAYAQAGFTRAANLYTVLQWPTD